MLFNFYKPRLTFEAFCPIDIDKPISWRNYQGPLRNIVASRSFHNNFSGEIFNALGLDRQWLSLTAQKANEKVMSLDGSGSGPPLNAVGRFAAQSLRNVWYSFSIAQEYLDQLPPKLNHMITQPGHPQDITIDVLGFQIRIESMNAPSPAIGVLQAPSAGFADDDPAPAKPEPRGPIMGQGLLNGSGVIMRYTP